MIDLEKNRGTPAIADGSQACTQLIPLRSALGRVFEPEAEVLELVDEAGSDSRSCPVLDVVVNRVQFGGRGVIEYHLIGLAGS